MSKTISSNGMYIRTDLQSLRQEFSFGFLVKSLKNDARKMGKSRGAECDSEELGSGVGMGHEGQDDER
ncbi:hypothetical protein MTR_4g109560 [Medicago truncatula]|uniref:Uncharacterized protein n=1 Tax=Medicago truncatula TaxID=3880 RepID=A0A072V1M7_MEDTR|nr:hypothetical protein MTR_4g109560 [Medicago truncatula]